MANPYVGEVGISWEGQDFTFRPSFFAISKLSNSPKEILEAFYAIQKTPISPMDTPMLLGLNILNTFYVGDDDIGHIIGRIEPVGERLEYVVGVVPPNDVMVLARELMARGISGVRTNNIKAGKQLRQFDPLKYVTDAVVHLGYTYDAAWGLTMIELQQALEAKYGKPAPEVTPQQLAAYEAAAMAEQQNKG